MEYWSRLQLENLQWCMGVIMPIHKDWDLRERVCIQRADMAGNMKNPWAKKRSTVRQQYPTVYELTCQRICWFFLGGIIQKPGKKIGYWGYAIELVAAYLLSKQQTSASTFSYPVTFQKRTMDIIIHRHHLWESGSSEQSFPQYVLIHNSTKATKQRKLTRTEVSRGNMEGRNCFSPDEFPRRAGSSPLSRQLPFKTNFQRMSLLSPSISSPKSPLSLKSKKSYFEDEKEPEMKDPLELVYTISTRRIRKALRSELLHHQEDVEEPFSLRTMDNPP